MTLTSHTPTKKPRIAPRRITAGRFKGTVQLSPVEDSNIDMIITIQFTGEDARMIRTTDPAVLQKIIKRIQIITGD